MIRLFTVSLFLLGFVSSPLAAQEAAPVEQPPATEEETKAADSGKPQFNPAEYDSIVFTHWEHVAIDDARRSRGSVRGVTDYELEQDQKFDKDPMQKPPPEQREIRLSGIVYNGVADWTIWLNEKRVTPDAVPKEVLDLKVYKTYIELKWFDEYTNQIFPVRLRPHQRFNVDTRIFLPG